MIKELKGRFGIISKENVRRAAEYIVLTGDEFTDYQSIVMLDMFRENLQRDTKTDLAKYNIADAMKTNITWTINLRSLQNFVTLRTNKAAHFEIRELAHKVVETIPDEHRYLIDEFVYKEK